MGAVRRAAAREAQGLGPFLKPETQLRNYQVSTV